MRDLTHIKSIVIGSVFGVLIFAGTAAAQNPTKEYRDWQRSQARAAQERNDYLRTRSMHDYRQWQAAERRAQEQYRQYETAVGRYGYSNNGYYNNGYTYNNTYNNGYNNSARYRVYRNGSYYSTDYRGAELLRQAVRNGYARGYQEGERDRLNGRRFNYTNDDLYRSGSYGYQNYVDSSQYRYYFQQGFEKGYEDGYNRTYRYGTRSANGFDILSGVLNTILNFAQ
jgi:hypothetical protein